MPVMPVPPPPVLDRQLLEQYVQSKNERAFAELVRRHLNLVHGAARRQAPQATDDITQAVFLLLARKAASLPQNRPLAGWLCQATRFCCATLKRDEALRRHHEQEAAAMAQTSASDKTLRNLLPLLDESLAKLSGGERDAVALRFLEGKSLAETGAELSITADAAAKRAGRGLEKLRAFFAKRGYIVPVAAVAGLLTAESAKAAPISVAAKVVVLGALGAVVSAKTAAIAKGAATMMTRIKVILAAAVCMAVLLPMGVVGVVVAHHATAPPRVNSAASGAPAFGPITAAQSATLPAIGQAVNEQAIPSGLYVITWDGTGQIVNRADTDGEAGATKVGLTKQLSGQLREPTLVSERNDNSQFRLSAIAGPIPEGADQLSLALMVAGQCIPPWGHSDRKADGTILVEGNVASKAAAEKIAAELNIKPLIRTHPRHQLLVTLNAQKPVYRPSEAVTLVMTIKNVGQINVRFYDGGSQRGARNNQFGFTAFHNSGHGTALPDIGDPTNYGGPAGLATLAPGDVFTKEVNLTDWFKLNDPDTYQIIGMYRLELMDERDPPFRVTLWDDFAVARCVVRVIAPPTTAPAVPGFAQPAR